MKDTEVEMCQPSRGRVIVLEGQDVICSLLRNGLGNLFLTPHRINRHHRPFEVQQAEEPTFKGSNCPCRLFALRAQHTTRRQDPVHRRAADDGVGHHISAQSLDHL